MDRSANILFDTLGRGLLGVVVELFERGFDFVCFSCFFGFEEDEDDEVGVMAPLIFNGTEEVGFFFDFVGVWDFGGEMEKELVFADGVAGEYDPLELDNFLLVGCANIDGPAASDGGMRD